MIRESGGNRNEHDFLGSSRTPRAPAQVSVRKKGANLGRQAQNYSGATPQLGKFSLKFGVLMMSTTFEPSAFITQMSGLSKRALRYACALYNITYCGSGEPALVDKPKTFLQYFLTIGEFRHRETVGICRKVDCNEGSTFNPMCQECIRLSQEDLALRAVHPFAGLDLHRGDFQDQRRSSRNFRARYRHASSRRHRLPK